MLSAASSWGASDQRWSETTARRSCSEKNAESPIGATISAYSTITPTFDCVNRRRSRMGRILSGVRWSMSSSSPSILPAFLANRQPVDTLYRTMMSFFSRTLWARKSDTPTRLPS